MMKRKRRKQRTIRDERLAICGLSETKRKGYGKNSEKKERVGIVVNEVRGKR